MKQTRKPIAKKRPATRARNRRAAAKQTKRGWRIAAFAAVALLLAATWLIVAKLGKPDEPQDVLAAVSVAASVGGAPPTQGAYINSPDDGDTTESGTIQVAGTCQPVTFVVITRNGISAGSASCSGSSTFAIDVSLLEGTNTLVAETYDFISQKGPDSNTVVITRTIPPTPPQPESPAEETPAPQSAPVVTLAPEQPPTTPDVAEEAFVVVIDTPFRRLGVNEDVSWPIRAQGGTPPYALNIHWGDERGDIAALADTRLYTLHHRYEKPGIYKVEISATDSKGRQTSLQATAAIATTQIEAKTETVRPATAGPQINWRFALGISTGVIVLIIVVWVGWRFFI